MLYQKNFSICLKKAKTIFQQLFNSYYVNIERVRNTSNTES